MVTLRNISAGEEITFSYLPASAEGSDSKRVRQEYTRMWYGFQCRCDICTLKVTAEHMHRRPKRIFSTCECYY